MIKFLIKAIINNSRYYVKLFINFSLALIKSIYFDSIFITHLNLLLFMIFSLLNHE